MALSALETSLTISTLKPYAASAGAVAMSCVAISSDAGHGSASRD